MLNRVFRGRLSFRFYASLIFILVISLIGLFLSQGTVCPEVPATNTKTAHQSPLHLSKLITVVFRLYDEFENDLTDSIVSFISAFPEISVVILRDTFPYPPIVLFTNVSTHNVKVMSFEFNLYTSRCESNPLTYLNTDFVLFVPDSVRVTRRSLHRAAVTALEAPNNAVVLGVGNKRVVCQHIKWEYADWTLRYSKDAEDKICDGVHGTHALLIRTSVLDTLPEPFKMPFPEALYLQTYVRNIKIQILDNKLGQGRSVMKTPEARRRSSRHMRDHKLNFYKQLGVKALVKEDGRLQWYGCRKETQRCFPSVKTTPSYLFEQRNTPPCCLRNMRRLVGHVLRSLQQAGVRCWLETTSLLGAVMIGDILPWAEYAEIGIHAADVARVTWLERGADADGYVWERATRGRYYRVAFSATNRVYVLLLPFEPRNGTMWPVDWVLEHQREFPERHLHPLAQIKFTDRQAPAPNDARAFIEIKLGTGAIEKCEKIGAKLLYPDAPLNN